MVGLSTVIVPVATKQIGCTADVVGVAGVGGWGVTTTDVFSDWQPSALLVFSK